MKPYQNISSSTLFSQKHILKLVLEKHDDEFGDFADVEFSDFGTTEPEETEIAGQDNMTEPVGDIYAAFRI